MKLMLGLMSSREKGTAVVSNVTLVVTMRFRWLPIRLGGTESAFVMSTQLAVPSGIVYAF